MTDRTAEFIQVCNGMQHIKRESSARPPPTPREGAEFTAAASEISKYVHVTSKRLEQLTKLVRQKSSVFQDPTEEINELTGQIKEDISNINLQLDNLQAYAVSRRPSFMGSNGGKHNSQSANHSEMVVGQMKSTLMRTTKGFKDILQVRQENMQLQHTRRARYGQSSASALGKPLAFPTPGLSTDPPQQLPRPTGVDASIEQQEIIPLIPTFSPHDQQQLVAPNQSYVETRAEAVEDIQSHIVELGQIFGRLSTMINEQGELVERIDDNVEDAVMNISAGQNELMQYMQHLSNNRTLMMQVGGILFLFTLFFLFFMA